MKGSKYILFNVAGDPTKDLIGTAVTCLIKKAYPEHTLIVTTLNPEIWLHNPDVARVYKLGTTPYFYEDYVESKESITFFQDPYRTDDYIHNRKHIIEIWCDLCNIPFTPTLPSLHFTYRELEATKRMMGRENATNPLLIIQAQGNPLPHLDRAWYRDIPLPIAEKVSRTMYEKGFDVVQIKNENEALLPSARPLLFNLRQTLCALTCADKIFCANSFVNHGSASVQKKALVFFVAEDPKVWGYSLQTALTPRASEEFTAFAHNFQESYSTPEERAACPYPLATYYDTDAIINLLLS